MDSICIACGKTFDCGADQSQCWCQTLPALDLSTLQDHEKGGCFCLACLHERLHRRPLSTPKELHQ
jgi:hypothetical protein